MGQGSLWGRIVLWYKGQPLGAKLCRGTKGSLRGPNYVLDRGQPLGSDCCVVGQGSLRGEIGDRTDDTRSLGR